MSSQFEPAFDELLKWEGGYAEPPEVEQPTNMGITLTDIQGDPAFLATAGITTPKELTRALASAYYQRNWWSAIPYEQIDEQETATLLFQLSVLVGQKTAIELLQEALASAGLAIKIDGVLGPSTLSEVNETNPILTRALFRLACVRHFVRLDKPQWLAGWLQRAIG